MNKNWFSVDHQFTVSNAKELMEFINAASFLMMDEVDIDYEESLKTNPKLAINMLESIGVKCLAETR
jgi:hypothetical protein